MLGADLRTSSFTRRDWSFFEHALTNHGRRSTSHGRRSRNTSSSMGENLRSHAEGGSVNINRELFPYYDNVPHLTLPFMEGWTDVRVDGKCGFRCVVDAFHGGQDNYLMARRIIAIMNLGQTLLITQLFIEGSNTSLKPSCVSPGKVADAI